MNLFDYNKFIECLDSLEDGNGTDTPIIFTFVSLHTKELHFAENQSSTFKRKAEISNNNL
ncbi:14029_t:CDS:2 [Entrophospora sp. SA101]|nr:14029_t:CDS:2 [Entrophospora sp. SA101]